MFTGVLKQIKKTMKNLNKSSRWSKIVLFLGITLILVIINNRNQPLHEGYNGIGQTEKFVSKSKTDVFDSFYTSIYDDLVYDQLRNNFEIGEIVRITKPTSQSLILVLGSRTGRFVNDLSQKGIKAIGVDDAPNMIAFAKRKYPGLEFKTGNATETILFPVNTFTHITALYFTIYYIKNKAQFFKNCMGWLRPGGYLVLHLVNRDKFDPILNTADPIHLVSAQKYAKKRLIKSLIKFKDFNYKAVFNLHKDKNSADFVETITDDKTKNVRQNTHHFYMPTQKSILSLAKSAGFILQGKVDMVSTQYEYQYLYILYKPE
jgi:SAM-dependent methyltransferase